MNESRLNPLNSNVKLFLSLSITLFIGFVAGFATASSIDTWYAGLKKPFYNPPNSLFAPVWTILYIMMGVAFYFVWKLPESSKRNFALFIFVIQLAFNCIWSFIFFNLHRIGWALADIVILWFMILATMYLFTQQSKIAAWLLYPYLLWVTFAAILNFSIYTLN